MNSSYLGKVLLVAVAMWACLATARNAVGQTDGRQNGSTHGRKSIRAVATEKPLVVDGNLQRVIRHSEPPSADRPELDGRGHHRGT